MKVINGGGGEGGGVIERLTELVVTNGAKKNEGKNQSEGKK